MYITLSNKIFKCLSKSQEVNNNFIDYNNLPYIAIKYLHFIKKSDTGS